MVYMLLFRNDYPYDITLPFKNSSFACIGNISQTLVIVIAV